MAASTKAARAASQFPTAALDLPLVKELSTGFYLVTPKVAQYWLDTHNSHNRNLVETRPKALVSDITSGDWKTNGDAIRFGYTPEGVCVLLDGQHRLAALISSGKTLLLMVVTGLEAASQETMDFGARRSFADVLTLRGAKNTVQLSALVNRIFQWESGATRATGSARTKATVAQLVRKWEELGDMEDHLATGKGLADRLHAPGSMFALCSYVFAQVERNQEGGPARTEKDADNILPDTDYFFARLHDGEGLAEGNPVLALRNMFMSNFASKTRYNDITLLAMTIKAWNHYRDGKALRVVTWRSGGSRPEPYPEPH